MKPSTFQCRFSHAARVAPLDVQGAVACVIALLEGGADPTERDFLVRPANATVASCILTHMSPKYLCEFTCMRVERRRERVGGREREREGGRESE
jgi:hypothetical protein